MFLTKSDEQLINKALTGSERSWVLLVKRYEGLVFNFCRRMTFSSDDAMDLMQEVFIAAFRNLPGYKGEGKFKGWLMRIANNKSIDFLRSRSRNPLHSADEFDDHPLHGGQTPEQSLITASSNKAIRQMLNELPDEQRIVVELKFFQHMTFEEIGHTTGTSTNTIKTRLYAALQKMKGSMEVKHAL